MLRLFAPYGGVWYPVLRSSVRLSFAAHQPPLLRLQALGDEYDVVCTYSRRTVASVASYAAPQRRLACQRNAPLQRRNAACCNAALCSGVGALQQVLLPRCRRVGHAVPAAGARLQEGPAVRYRGKKQSGRTGGTGDSWRRAMREWVTCRIATMGYSLVPLAGTRARFGSGLTPPFASRMYRSASAAWWPLTLLSCPLIAHRNLSRSVRSVPRFAFNRETSTLMDTCCVCVSLCA
jgi:hypothetical protein